LADGRIDSSFSNGNLESEPIAEERGSDHLAKIGLADRIVGGELHGEHGVGMGPCLREADVRMGDPPNKGISEAGRAYVECPSCVHEPAGTDPIPFEMPEVGADTTR
jgi:hypothetical protein